MEFFIVINGRGSSETINTDFTFVSGDISDKAGFS